MLDKPWYEKELFTVGKVKVTVGAASATTAIVIIICILAFSISSYIAYRNKNKIAE